MEIYLLTRSTALYSSKRLIEAARYRGHVVTPVDYMNCKLVVETGVSAVVYQGIDLITPKAVIPRIGASFTSYGSAVVRQFEIQGAYTPVTSQGLLLSRDKFSCLQVLAQEGIPIAPTGYASSSQGLKILAAEFQEPYILKLLQGTQGLGVLKINGEKELHNTLDAFEQLKARALIQKFIKESSGQDIRAIVVGDEVVASMKRIAPEGEFRSNIHRGGVGQKIELSDDEKSIAVKSVKALGLEVAGVDMLLSESGPLVIEVNSSPGLEGIENTTKIDVAQCIIKHIERTA